MTGHNHRSSCTCPWCVSLGRAGFGPMVYQGGAIRSAFRTLESFTIPNASCPVCGASVFFYQSPSGGRVFFDELGPPWPKHPCTVAPAASVSTRTPRRTSRMPMPTWVRAGWTPVIIKPSRMKGTWHCVPMQMLDRNLHVETFTTEPMVVPGQICAMFRSYDAEGVGMLSYVNLDSPEEIRNFMAFEPRRYAARSPFVIARRF